MKIKLHILYLSLIVLSFSYTYYLHRELSYSDDDISNLYSKIEDLEDEIEDLKDTSKDIVELTPSTNSDIEYYESKIALLEQEVESDDKRSIKTEVFYDMIKGSEFEENILSVSYQDPSRPKLSKVIVYVEGTRKMIDFFQHLYEQYRWLYIETNFK